MGYGLREHSLRYVQRPHHVLILVLMEYGLRESLVMDNIASSGSLNPCFNGIWSASEEIQKTEALSRSS